MKRVLEGLSRTWSNQSGAAIVFESNSPDAADLVIATPRAFGSLAARGQLRPLDPALRQAGHPYQFSQIPESLSEGVAGWSGLAVGVILAVDTPILLYRKDRLEDRALRDEYRTTTSRELGPPATWEELSEIAEFLAARGRKSLPPLPRAPGRLLLEYHLIAACYDRPAVTASNRMGRDLMSNQFAAELVSFHFDFDTLNPRLNSPGFVRAAELMARLQKSRADGTGDDPIAALQGDAVFAVAALSELSKLPRGPDGAIADRFGVARLPGTRTFYDSLTRRFLDVKLNEANVVPFLGHGGWIGAVTTRCAHPAAAFELLVEWGGPSGSATILGEPAIGSGPWRTSHLETDRKAIWLGYGFGPAMTNSLIQALGAGIITDVRNPAIALRGPHTESLDEALERAVRRAITGELTPSAAMSAAQTDWLTREATTGTAEERRTWRRGDLRSK